MNQRQQLVIVAAVVVGVIAVGAVMALSGGGNGGDGQQFQDPQDAGAPPSTWAAEDSPGEVTFYHEGGQTATADGLYVLHDGQRYDVGESLSSGSSLTFTADQLGTTFDNGDTVRLVWDEGNGQAVLHEHELSNQ